MSLRLLLVDNRDSFTYNLVHELRQLGGTLEVHRNDRPVAALLDRVAPDGVLVLSPGPGAPEDAGNLLDLLGRAVGRVPVLGVCLGHQALVRALGGRVARSAAPCHGRASAVHHAGHPLFAGIPSPFSAGRYHSLVATELPVALEAIAHTADGAVMAVAGRSLPVIGVQFHPESILTPAGHRVLANALDWLTDARRRQPLACSA